MRAHYGFDAPGIMLGLSLGGGAVVALGCVIVALAPGAWRYCGILVALLGAVPMSLGLLMVIYAFFGKVRTREHILDLAKLRGDETVLDVGTGAGLLLVGAAKRMQHGKVVGIDLWASKDLSNNAAATTMRNVMAESVAARVNVQTGDARELAFPDASFDRAVSLLCIHNIEGKVGQARACHEIARVLKPGGRVVIGDYVPTHAYAAAFKAAGLTIVQSKPAFGVALSLMWILVADKSLSPRKDT
ncbi:class I SAM-dependent methyltransferase [Sphingomonas sp. PAMC 26621]|uniref:class I SAM-dependent methyltransferase n=1 Tax=Sphingomonas sp. PAMC 26621 TaxID=1112213 RepID=UPI000288E74E|nr:methyltransferase domain-containing protein [Sphingomonas sp. PAMC 26621]